MNDLYYSPYYGRYISHHGIKGQKWGIRRFQNEDGSLTSAGRSRYGSGEGRSSSGSGRSGMSETTKRRLKTAGKVALGAAAAGAIGYGAYRYAKSRGARPGRLGVGAAPLRIGTQSHNYFRNNTLRLTDSTHAKASNALALRSNGAVGRSMQKQGLNVIRKDRRPLEIAGIAAATGTAGALATKAVKKYNSNPKVQQNRAKMKEASAAYDKHTKSLKKSQRIIDNLIYSPGTKRYAQKLMAKKGLSAADARKKAHSRAWINTALVTGGIALYYGANAYSRSRGTALAVR